MKRRLLEFFFELPQKLKDGFFGGWKEKIIPPPVAIGPKCEPNSYPHSSEDCREGRQHKKN